MHKSALETKGQCDKDGKMGKNGWGRGDDGRNKSGSRRRTESENGAIKASTNKNYYPAITSPTDSHLNDVN